MKRLGALQSKLYIEVNVSFFTMLLCIDDQLVFALLLPKRNFQSMGNELLGSRSYSKSTEPPKYSKTLFSKLFRTF